MKNPAEIHPGDKMRFLSDLLRKQTELLRQIEARANVAIGFGGAMLTFTINSLDKEKTDLMPIISIFFALTAIILGLMALKPPQIFSRRGKQEQSVFYHTAIANTEYEYYKEKVEDILTDDANVVKQYTLEIHNLTAHSLCIKKRFAHLSISMIVLGLFVSAIIALVRIV